MTGSLRQLSEVDAEASDDHLIARTLAGETEAFSILVRRWERPIYSLTLRMLGRDEDARDACQEAFLAAFRNLNKFRGDAKFSSWMYRIALNACHTRLRNSNGISYSLDEEDDVEAVRPVEERHRRNEEAVALNAGPDLAGDAPRDLPIRDVTRCRRHAGRDRNAAPPEIEDAHRPEPETDDP